MRFTDPLNNPDELTEVVQLLGYEEPNAMIMDMLTGTESDETPHAGALAQGIDKLPAYVNSIIAAEQSVVVDEIVKSLQNASLNDILLFGFKPESVTDIAKGIVDVANGRAANSNGNKQGRIRLPSRTVSKWEFNGSSSSCKNFSDMLNGVMGALADMYSKDFVSVACNANGRFSKKAGETGRWKQMHGVYVQLHAKAYDLEASVRKLIVAFGHKAEELILTP